MALFPTSSLNFELQKYNSPSLTIILEAQAGRKIGSFGKRYCSLNATSHLTISLRGQRETGKIQRTNYHHGNCGQFLTGKTSSITLIFTHEWHQNVKNR